MDSQEVKDITNGEEHNINSFWSPQLIYPDNIVPDIAMRRLITKMISSREQFCSKNEEERQAMLMGPTMFALSKMQAPAFCRISIIPIDTEYPEFLVSPSFRRSKYYIFPFSIFDWTKLALASGKVDVICAKIDMHDATLFCKWLPIIFYDVIDELYDIYQKNKLNRQILSSIGFDKVQEIELAHRMINRENPWGKDISEIIIHCVDYPGNSVKIGYKALTDFASGSDEQCTMDVEVDALGSSEKWVDNSTISEPFVDYYDLNNCESNIDENEEN
ncbi:hypothetical protein TVAG_168380 [Trichomonas vaginalis G3]|uniref:Uncharacterized protein n=1 Tax=Trichomonas vaginalis (strain ATCC PRA-98 / G3) TaxID=412133 RepID=A2F2E1_TRIV3|nr:hypothetical protein TVAGG3_0252860 [Trichomonas vaginalis G3]XP_051113085.1 hypothetical protein TVAGG3_0252900 [Trichomonas vaginalis G3]EAY00907.1 hypothetical protein TVAG_168380 [Trichomonas vaginalis G3]KAI5554142.1 hypothetical protein TVAGG3_0252860 [Trichomonas vaginalis G3]KAI5554146.1 hypothetical protein TVAGG3_0252900 [Trichomonas vaginalis G3]|eukprot:XP_001313836.1 hypothetical protein [Trichomonas vaginalis G3]